MHVFSCGVWDKKCKLSFQSFSDTGSYVTENGNGDIDVDLIDNIVGDVPIGLIKMDVEGAELHALKGAIKTLENFKPILTISAYHKAEDLITIPQFVKSTYGKCSFYLRQHDPNGLIELDLYVIPD